MAHESPAGPALPARMADPHRFVGLRAIAARFQRSFTTKLGVTIALTSLVPLIVTSAFVMHHSVKAMTADAEEMVRLMRDAGATSTRSFLQERFNDLEVWSGSIILNDPHASPALKSKALTNPTVLTSAFVSMNVVAPTGRVTASSNPKAIGKVLPEAVWAQRGAFRISKVAWLQGTPTFMVACPLKSTPGRLVAVVDLNALRPALRASRARGSGETYLVAQDGRLIGGSRFLTAKESTIRIDTEGRERAASGQSGVALYRDYRGVEVVGAYAPVRITGDAGPPDWGILSEMDVAEALAPVRQLEEVAIVFTLLLALLTLVVIIMASRQISRPLHALDATAASLADGHLDRRVPTLSQDEFGRVGTTFNLMAERLEHQVASLETMAGRLQELNRFKSDYIHAISHDLRLPLTVIKGYTELLDDSPAVLNDAHNRTYTGHIDRAAHRLQLMIDDLLDTARLEAGTFTLNLDEFDLGCRLKATIESLQLTAGDADVRLTLALPDEPLLAHADGDRVDRVVANLVGNALKFTPAGGAVRVTACREGAFIRCEVADTGAGISESDAARLFKPFSQLDGGRQKQGGTGLGLSICRAIVEAHGGAIGVESTPGQGATFWFTLPAGRSPA